MLMFQYLPTYLFYVIVMIIMVTWTRFVPTVKFRIKNITVAEIKPIVLPLLIWFLLSALRYGIGRDYIIYWENLDLIKKEYWDYKDPLAYVFSHLIINYNLAYQWFYVVYALCSSIALYYMFKVVDEKDHYLVFLLLFALSFLNYSFNTMRQAVALPIIIYATSFIFRKKILTYALLIGLASFFHYSAMLMLPAYFLGKVKINQMVFYVLLIISFGLFVTQFHLKAVYAIMAKIPQYSHYLGSRHDSVTNLGSGLGFLFKFSSALLVTLFYPLGNSKKEAFCRIFFNFYMFGILLELLFFHIWVLSRITEYFTYFLIVVFPMVWSNFKHQNNKIIILILLLGYFALWSKDILFPNINKCVPYQIFYDFKRGVIKSPYDKYYEIKGLKEIGGDH